MSKQWRTWRTNDVLYTVRNQTQPVHQWNSYVISLVIGHFLTWSQRTQPRIKFLNFISRQVKSSSVGVVFLCVTVICYLGKGNNWIKFVEQLYFWDKRKGKCPLGECLSPLNLTCLSPFVKKGEQGKDKQTVKTGSLYFSRNIPAYGRPYGWWRDRGIFVSCQLRQN